MLKSKILTPFLRAFYKSSTFLHPLSFHFAQTKAKKPRTTAYMHDDAPGTSNSANHPGIGYMWKDKPIFAAAGLGSKSESNPQRIILGGDENTMIRSISFGKTHHAIIDGN